MKIVEERDGWKMTHEFEEMTPEKRPQDPCGDRTGLVFETLEHGGEYPDTMPQAIRVTDTEDRVSGPIELRDTNGNILATQTRTVLCRCGASRRRGRVREAAKASSVRPSTHNVSASPICRHGRVGSRGVGQEGAEPGLGGGRRRRGGARSLAVVAKSVGSGVIALAAVAALCRAPRRGPVAIRSEAASAAGPRERMDAAPERRAARARRDGCRGRAYRQPACAYRVDGAAARPVRCFHYKKLRGYAIQAL